MHQDEFLRLLPLPYRLAIVIILGIWLWGAVLYLYKPLPRLINYPSAEPEDSTWTFSSVMSLFLLASVATYCSVVKEDDVAASRWLPLPTATLLLILLAFLPINIPGIPFPRHGRSRFFSTMRRIALGGLARKEEERFGDILAADALTSYARTISELYLVFCLFLPGTNDIIAAKKLPGANVMVPLLQCYPFVVRFRQCLTAHQFANALKYAMSLLPIIIGAVISSQTDPSTAPDTGAETFSLTSGSPLGYEHPWLMRFWFISTILSTSYSLWWDLFMDWDFVLLSSEGSPKSHGHPSRRRLPWRVWFGIVLTTLGRFAWVLCISHSLEIYSWKERSIFVFEMFEVVRRAGWLVLRAETEGARRALRLGGRELI